VKLQKQKAYRLVDNRYQYKYVVTLPESLVEELGWKEGSELGAAIRERSLVIDFISAPVKRERRVVVTKMTYDDFRDKIRQVLEYNDKGMTWTEIRNYLRLDQVVPNNKWVRLLEKDIGLVRTKRSDGVIIWRVAHVR
jgi:antitoxin component of MazEF toxin-antitoxin module